MNGLYSDFEQLPVLLTASDLAKILRISRANAYTVMHSRDIATIRIGKRMLVMKDELIRYIKEKTQGDYQNGLT